MEGVTAGSSNKRPHLTIDKFGTTLIQNVYRYFKAMEEGPRPTDEFVFSKPGRKNIFKLTAGIVGVSEATVKKHVALNADEIPTKKAKASKNPRQMKMWLPQGNTESDQEIRAAAYDFMRHREQQAKAKSHGKAKATATTTTAPATAGNQLPEKNRHV